LELKPEICDRRNVKYENHSKNYFLFRNAVVWGLLLAREETWDQFFQGQAWIHLCIVCHLGFALADLPADGLDPGTQAFLQVPKEKKVFHLGTVTIRNKIKPQNHYTICAY